MAPNSTGAGLITVILTVVAGEIRFFDAVKCSHPHVFDWVGVLGGFADPVLQVMCIKPSTPSPPLCAHRLESTVLRYTVSRLSHMKPVEKEIIEISGSQEI
jgi:hypothetical protein